MSAANTVLASSVFNVQMKNNMFSPVIMQVNTGDTITWENRDPNTHTITGFDVNRTLNSGEAFSYTFNNPGTYDYVCTIHSGMTGKIIVTDKNAETVISEPVTADNAVVTLLNSLDETNISTPESVIETSISGVLSDLKSLNEDDMASALNDIKNDIESNITSLSSKIKTDINALRKIQILKNFLVRLRARAIIQKNVNPEDVSISADMPKVYRVRWGNLDAKRKRCTGISLAELRESLQNNVIPDACDTGERIRYQGIIEVSKGTISVNNKIRFESADRITDPSGTSVAFTSDIYGDWDGLFVEYTPPATDDGSPLKVTIKLGDFNETFTGDSILGSHDIGNGQSIEITKQAGFVTGLSEVMQKNLIKSSLNIQDAIAIFMDKLDMIRMLKQVGDGADEIESVLSDAGNYNFDTITGGKLEYEINRVAKNLNIDTASSDLDKLAKDLADKISAFKSESGTKKFEDKIIPFKDTDDDQWYTPYVAAVKNNGIISGYKDDSGNEIGEFRPGNNITVAELLKIALEASGNGQSENTPSLKSAVNHWAMGYAAKAEELGLNIVQNDVSLDRPATRAEVVRTVLEVFGIKPPAITSTDFSDVNVSDENAAFIQYAKNVGIVSGDSGKTTFRPEDPINRAEVAKIINQVISVLMGGL